MNYAEDPFMCRVDFFRASGKWYTTEAIDMIKVWGESDMIDAVHKAIVFHTNGRLNGMTAVCLEPYHEHSHPVMVIV